MLVMLCGYRGSGKDYTFQVLQNGEKLQNHWNIYYHRCKLSETMVKSYFNSGLLPHRVASADALKDRVCDEFGFSRKELEEKKEQNLPREFYLQHPQVPDCVVSYRHLLCFVGLQERQKDPHHWISQVGNKIKYDRLNILTDFRLPSEIILQQLTGMEALTVRVVRADNSIPEVSLPLEHELDDFITDLVLSDLPLQDLNEHVRFGWYQEIPHYQEMKGI